MTDQELFGTVAQRRLLWRLLMGHPRYAYYGTDVALSDPRADTADIMTCPARFQGLGMCFYAPIASAGTLTDTLATRGLRVVTSNFHRSGRAAYQVVCAKLGIIDTKWVTAFCFDDERLAAS